MDAPQLNVNDLLSVVKIIDACSERGAFKGNELASVGAVRERIAAFAQVNMPKTEETEESEETPEYFGPEPVPDTEE